MRLITYDRGGARRLGAWVGETVVDLPEAVGHPAFPPTMEALVQRSGGSILDAAGDMLRDEAVVAEFSVARPRLLVPFVATSEPLAVPANGRRSGANSEAVFRGGLACIIRGGRPVPARGRAGFRIFGYTLAVQLTNPEWGETTTWLGPAVVTADEMDGTQCRLAVSVDGKRCHHETIPAIEEIFRSVVTSKWPGRPVHGGDVLTSIRWSFGGAISTRGGVPRVFEVWAPRIGGLRMQAPPWMRMIA
jgi:hypothetical protein